MAWRDGGVSTMTRSNRGSSLWSWCSRSAAMYSLVPGQRRRQVFEQPVGQHPLGLLGALGL